MIARNICSKYSYLWDMRRTLNYLERITLYDLTLMMSMNDPVAISMERLMRDSVCYLEKEFTKLIGINS